MVLPEAESVILENIFGANATGRVNSDRSSAAIRYPVPMRPGAPDLGSLLCLNWPYFLSDAEKDAGFSFLSENQLKHAHTKSFLDFIENMADPVQSLSAEFLPATRLMFMKAIGGVRMKFSDAAGVGVDPPISFKIEFRHQG